MEDRRQVLSCRTACYGRVVETVTNITKGALFAAKNVSEGHMHEDWTVEKMMTIKNKETENHFCGAGNT